MADHLKLIKPSKRPTYFIDLDGTLVRHHHDPKDYPAVAEILPGALKWLFSLVEQNAFLILTTGRSKREANPVIKQLKKLGIKFNAALFDLPVGIRLLVNDDAYDGECKAFAIRHKRNGAWE